MIPKPVNEIGLDDLQALIDGEVAENKTLEYKREMPGGGDPIPFLAAVSAFANTSGGDLLIGVEAVEGVPQALPGVEVASVDQETLRLTQVVGTSLEPRLPRIDFQFVEVGNGRHVIVARVPHSWVAPHRVRKNDKFYGRNSAGKYPLDVGEIRTAFTLSEGVAERIRAFRADRIAKIYGGETPVPIRDGGCMVLHVLPLAAFTEPPALDLSDYYSRERPLRPLAAEGGLGRINLDGFVSFTDGGDAGSRAYTQLFRSGVIEAVAGVHVHDDERLIPSQRYEEVLIGGFRNYADAIFGLGVEPPLFVFLSFVGVRGCRFGVGRLEMFADKPEPLREDVLVLPEVVLENAEFEPAHVMRPLFDMVWNAFGLQQSVNYDKAGNWVGRR